jgi:hypothetical protein
MKNERLLKQAISLLQEVDSNELETVQINHTKYDDGSIGFTVELVYPEVNKEEKEPKKEGYININHIK